MEHPKPPVIYKPSKYKYKRPTPPKGWKGPPEPTENTPLNVRQSIFVKQIVENDHMTKTEAARLAGYADPGRMGCVMYKQPHIAKAIREGRAEFAKLNAMTKQKVMNGFLDAIAQAKAMSDPTAQIQGWNSVAKMCGYFEPTRHKVEITVEGKQIIQHLQSLSDEELLHLSEQDGDAEVIEGEFTALPAPAPKTTSDVDEGGV